MVYDGKARDNHNSHLALQAVRLQMVAPKVHGFERGTKAVHLPEVQISLLERGSSKERMTSGRVYSFYVKDNPRLQAYLESLRATKELSSVIVDLLEARMNAEPTLIKNRIQELTIELKNEKDKLHSLPQKEPVKETHFNRKDFDLLIFNLRAKGNVTEAKKRINEAIQKGYMTIGETIGYEL